MKTIDFRHDLLPLKDRIFRLALRITLSREEAEDVTQDTLLRVWEQRDSLTDIRSLEAYVLTIGHRLAIDRTRRAETANLSIEDAQVDAPDSSPDAQEQLERQESLQRIHEIFNSLPPPQRTVIQLRDIEGKSYRDIADITGLTEDNVKVTLYRARQAVKNQFLKTNENGL